jgi:hypothetical protein
MIRASSPSIFFVSDGGVLLVDFRGGVAMMTAAFFPSTGSDAKCGRWTGSSPDWSHRRAGEETNENREETEDFCAAKYR